MKPKYLIETPLENPNLLHEMSILYSENYGLWGETARNPFTRIKLSKERLSLWTSKNNTYIATARCEDQLIGYAIATVASTNKKEPDNKSKIISWVTQLVVHEKYREQGIAKNLLLSFWGLSNYYAWGILSSNPYAVKALESATKRVSHPAIINKKKKKIISFGKNNIHYITQNTEFIINDHVSKANTMFPSDISNILTKLKSVEQKSEKEWIMGDIEEGWEWFAFTFNEQDIKNPSKEEITELLDSFDAMAQDAYSRMLIDNNHKWSKHTNKEVSFIIDKCDLSKDSEVLDFGCGIGRHSIALGEKIFHVMGIDYTQELVQKAQEANSFDSVIFQVGDCRTINLNQEYNAVLCLYDVIGSFIHEKDNMQILQNIYQHTKKDGYAIISVMNYELTKHIAKHIFTFEKEPDHIFKIPPSEIMEKTGNIFNPKYYIIDESTRVIYRREQFTAGTNLPREFIVRDKRYTKDEIETMCQRVGFKIIFSRYVQAGKWDTCLSPTDKNAKEILVLCQKD
ncbi:GNAT family N-acetyltransferase [Sulfurospirillum sp.]|uniref:GNAT family N-acetyltransferase n=1 Tax=Sulfurospirillum sp. TaxID=2053622 RepID=UPI002FDD2A5C